MSFTNPDSMDYQMASEHPPIPPLSMGAQCPYRHHHRHHHRQTLQPPHHLRSPPHPYLPPAPTTLAGYYHHQPGPVFAATPLAHWPLPVIPTAYQPASLPSTSAYAYNNSSDADAASGAAAVAGGGGRESTDTREPRATGPAHEPQPWLRYDMESNDQIQHHAQMPHSSAHATSTLTSLSYIATPPDNHTGANLSPASSASSTAGQHQTLASPASAHPQPTSTTRRPLPVPWSSDGHHRHQAPTVHNTHPDYQTPLHLATLRQFVLPPPNLPSSLDGDFDWTQRAVDETSRPNLFHSISRTGSDASLESDRSPRHTRVRRHHNHYFHRRNNNNEFRRQGYSEAFFLNYGESPSMDEHDHDHERAHDHDDEFDMITFTEYRSTSEREDAAARERAMAIARGARAAIKPIPTPAAIASLESVKMEDLAEEDRTCMICYDTYGEENPEGVRENPLRLPKCKHVFGDVCIKRWFESSDSCPYCREKLPSAIPATIRRPRWAIDSYTFGSTERDPPPYTGSSGNESSSSSERRRRELFPGLRDMSAHVLSMHTLVSSREYRDVLTTSTSTETRRRHRARAARSTPSWRTSTPPSYVAPSGVEFGLSANAPEYYPRRMPHTNTAGPPAASEETPTIRSPVSESDLPLSRNGAAFSRNSWHATRTSPTPIPVPTINYASGVPRSSSNRTSFTPQSQPQAFMLIDGVDPTRTDSSPDDMQL